MTSVLYFLHLKTLDFLLLIVNISVADDAFYKYFFFIVVILRLHFYMKMLIFNSFLLLLRTERRKNQSEEWTYFTLYFIIVNKYRFCILVIGYINIQIIGIGFK